jgi:ribose/xylose/arabinose/galactoside ABC-type transport system permease subunit
MDRVLAFLARRAVLTVLIVLFAVFALLTPSVFLGGQNVSNVARQVSFNGIIALGQTVVLISGGIDISVGAVLSMAAALTMGLQPYGVGVAVGAALLFGLLVGVVNGALVTKVGIPPFIATLGSMTVVQGLMLSYTHQQPIPGDVPWFTVFGGGSLGPIPVPTLFLAAVALFCYWLLNHTRTGRNFYAVGGNPDAARLAGIDLDLYRFLPYVLSGFCAALSGVLLASLLNTSTIHIGLDTPLAVLAAAIMGGASLLGGRGTVGGTLLGVVALGILSNGMDLLGVFTYYQIAIRALILVAVVVIDSFYTARMQARARQAHAA